MSTGLCWCGESVADRRHMYSHMSAAEMCELASIGVDRVAGISASEAVELASIDVRPWHP